MVAAEFHSALDAWASRLGSDHVLSGSAAQQKFGPTTLGTRRTIGAALRPASADEIPGIVDIARRFGIPLYPVSTGHNWGYGSAHPVSEGCVVLDLSSLDRILSFDAELGLVTLEPGVTQGALSAYLERNDYRFLVPVTGGGPQCSLVGNALERGYGITPFADHFAAVTALEAVLPDGQIYRSALHEMGGAEVDAAHKWSIGPYLDGLFAQGNFGIVTKMTIALAPRPEKIQAFFFGIKDGARIEGTVVAIRKVLQSAGGVVGSINLMNARRVLAMMAPQAGGDDVLSAAAITELARTNGIMEWMGLGALYGSGKIVDAARRVVRAELAPHVDRLSFVTPERAALLHRCVGHIPFAGRSRIGRFLRTLDAGLQLVAGKPNETALPLAYLKSRDPHPARGMDPDRDGCGLIWYPPLVPMKPERVRAFVSMVEAVCTAHGFDPLITLSSLSPRCFDSSVPLLFDARDASAATRAHACYDALFDAGKAEGFLPYRLGIHSMHRLTDIRAPFRDILVGIKRSIDPHGIIAPGRYVPMD